MAVVKLDRKRRRTYAGEEEWFDLLERLGPTALRRAFIRCGLGARQAAALVGFIEDQRDLAPFTQTDTARVEYRKILRSMDQEDVLAAACTTPG